jgi:cell division protein FtsI (penicillin-binding protein 3)
MEEKGHKQPRIKDEIWFRVGILYLCFILVGVAIVARIIYIQWGAGGDKMRESANDKNFELSTLEATRGKILSENDELLVTTLTEYRVKIDFKAGSFSGDSLFAAMDSLTVGLARIVGDKTAEEYKDMITRAWDKYVENSLCTLSSRSVTYDELKRISALPMMSPLAYREVEIDFLAEGFTQKLFDKKIKKLSRKLAKIVGDSSKEEYKKLITEGWYNRQNVRYLRLTPKKVSSDKYEGISKLPLMQFLNNQAGRVVIDFRHAEFTNKNMNNGIDTLAKSLAFILGEKTVEEYKSMITTAWRNHLRVRHCNLTAHHISYHQLQQMRKLRLLELDPNKSGMAKETRLTRVKPYGHLASRTLGNSKSATTSVEKPVITINKESKLRRLIGGITTRLFESLVSERSDTLDSIDKKPVAVPPKPTTVSIDILKGGAGVEGAYDSVLNGKTGWMLKQRFAKDLFTPVTDSESNVEFADGRDIVLTLDMDLQDIASSKLEEQVLRYGARWGTVVLMEVATGEIKAMANLRNDNGKCYDDYNYAVGNLGRTEPGSTFKLATLLALLDDGMTLNTPVFVGNGIKHIPREVKPIRDDHTPEERYISLKRVFETSSNVGFVNAVESRFTEKKREKEFVDYMVKLGFDTPPYIGLSGEARPKFYYPTPEYIRRGAWHLNSLTYMSHGYGPAFSPMHTLILYNAVANNGEMVKPMLVKEIREGERTIQSFATEVLNPCISRESTIKAAREALEGVVEKGTAAVLKSPYYKVAAKTGTAQQKNSDYPNAVGTEYLASMVGYFPADNPQYSCIVCLYTDSRSTNRTIYGSTLAGPVFKAIADRVYVSHIDWQEPVNRQPARSAVTPEVKGGLAQSVDRATKELGVGLKDSSGQESWAITTRGATAVSAAPLSIEKGKMPLVVGMGLQDALFLLENEGLAVDFAGRGRVVEQQPSAGQGVEKGEKVTILLKPSYEIK